MSNYKDILAEKLDELREIEGFPKGTDEDILNLSDPPNYTACPNPFIDEFIKLNGKSYDTEKDNYHCEPYVGDVSEGKNDPIYNAHTYHTKVPHKAIMKYIQHYTAESDIVLDGFCGTGMTGVAARLLNRKAILTDISPIASFIAFNYNRNVDTIKYAKEAQEIVDAVENECSWMYQTKANLKNYESNSSKQIDIYKETTEDASQKGIINYMVWSDVFICPFCQQEHVFMSAAFDRESGKVLDSYNCPNCSAIINKRDTQPALKTYFDPAVKKEISQIKQVPYLINYTIKIKKNGKWKNEKRTKIPDAEDIALIEKINRETIPYWFPTERMMLNEDERWGDAFRAGYHLGITHTHHFYTKRNLWVLAKLFNECIKRGKEYLIIFQSISTSLCSKLARYNMGNRGNGPVSGTLYIASMTAEANVIKLFRGKSLDFAKAFEKLPTNKNAYVSCSSTLDLRTISDNSIDYIFTDPPFGDNLMYSELNFLWESWLRVFTNSKSEAIINKTQNKGLSEYKYTYA